MLTSSRSSDIDHKMLDLSVIKSSDEKKNCPRCGGQASTASLSLLPGLPTAFTKPGACLSAKPCSLNDIPHSYQWSSQVFKAEEIASGGRSYHKKCATCFACEKQLTFNTVFDGDDR